MRLILILIVTLFTLFSQNSFSKKVQFEDLQLKEGSFSTIERWPSSYSTAEGLFSTKNLAWSTMAFLGATALTGRHGKASPIHVSMASLSILSYGMFVNSYFQGGASSNKAYKAASYAKWLHIPAMLLVSVAGSIALADFDQGKTEAEGFGKIHKPAALASIVGISLATLSLTFEF